MRHSAETGEHIVKRINICRITARHDSERAFARAGITLEWRGAGTDEQGIDANDGRVLVEIDPRYFRPTEVDVLLGDASRAKRALGWEPRVSFGELIDLMVDADLQLAANEAKLR